MNVAVFATTGVFGVSFLYQAMRPAADGDGDENVKVRDQILRLWLGLYGFVGSQLGWTLRPFFGSSDQFVLFRERDGNFLNGVWMAIQRVMGF
jgi:hypothetical protein